MLKKTFDDKQIKLSEMSPTHKQRTQTGQQPLAELTGPRPKLNCLFSVLAFSLIKNNKFSSINFYCELSKFMCAGEEKVACVNSLA